MPPKVKALRSSETTAPGRRDLRHMLPEASAEG